MEEKRAKIPEESGDTAVTREENYLLTKAMYCIQYLKYARYFTCAEILFVNL